MCACPLWENGISLDSNILPYELSMGYYIHVVIHVQMSSIQWKKTTKNASLSTLNLMLHTR